MEEIIPVVEEEEVIKEIEEIETTTTVLETKFNSLNLVTNYLNQLSKKNGYNLYHFSTSLNNNFRLFKCCSNNLKSNLDCPASVLISKFNNTTTTTTTNNTTSGTGSNFNWNLTEIKLDSKYHNHDLFTGLINSNYDNNKSINTVQKVYKKKLPKPISSLSSTSTSTTSTIKEKKQSIIFGSTSNSNNNNEIDEEDEEEIDQLDEDYNNNNNNNHNELNGFVVVAGNSNNINDNNNNKSERFKFLSNLNSFRTLIHSKSLVNYKPPFFPPLEPFFYQ